MMKSDASDFQQFLRKSVPDLTKTDAPKVTTAESEYLKRKIMLLEQTNKSLEIRLSTSEKVNERITRERDNLNMDLEDALSKLKNRTEKINKLQAKFRELEETNNYSNEQTKIITDVQNRNFEMRTKIENQEQLIENYELKIKKLKKEREDQLDKLMEEHEQELNHSRQILEANHINNISKLKNDVYTQEARLKQYANVIKNNEKRKQS
eukprot:UN30824